MHYTYVLRSKKDNKWYTGCTGDLRKRLKKHNSGSVSQTKGRGPFSVIYYEACHNKDDAFQREKYLKTGMGKRYLKNRLKRFLSLTGLIVFTALGLAGSVDAAVISTPPNNLGLVGYWSMDDGSGTQAGDVSGNGNHGTLTNMEEADWVAGKRGTALEFDGVNDYVSTTFNGVGGSGARTVSAWIKTTTHGAIINWGTVSTGAKWHFRLNDSAENGTVGALRTEVQGSYRTGSADITDNAWHHVVSVYDGTSFPSGLTHYIDGVAETASGSGGSQAINTSTADSVLIGARNQNGITSNFTGSIDDVRIYNRALSALEISSLYGSGVVTRKQLSKANLVGHWTFDDGSGTQAGDVSGNGNHGTLTNMEEIDWVDGKRGKALEFDGVDDHVNIGTTPAELQNLPESDFSICVWINPRSMGEGSAGTIYSNYDNTVPPDGIDLLLRGVGGDVRALQLSVGFPDADVLKISVDNSVTLNEWQHICAVFTESTKDADLYKDGVLLSLQNDTNGAGTYGDDSSNNLRIGNQRHTTNRTFDGKIDDLRVYTTALSVADITALYQEGVVTRNVSQETRISDGLVGMWTFDGPDVSGTTISDVSGNGNDGTATNGPKPAAGAIGQAYEFDGVDDYVDVTDDVTLDFGTGDFSVSTWVKRGVTGDFHTILDKRQDGSPAFGFLVGISSSNKAQMFLQDGSSTNASINSIQDISAGDWYHLVFNFDRDGSGRVYINGQEDNSGSISSVNGTMSNNENLRIGHSTLSPSSWGHFSGSIDNVRLFSRTLTDREITNLYKLGR